MKFIHIIEEESKTQSIKNLNLLEDVYWNPTNERISINIDGLEYYAIEDYFYKILCFIVNDEKMLFIKVLDIKSIIKSK